MIKYHLIKIFTNVFLTTEKNHYKNLLFYVNCYQIPHHSKNLWYYISKGDCMPTIKKKRLKLKKKNFTILILSICLIIFCITKITQTITNFINNTKEKEIKEETTKNKEKEPKKEKTKEEIKLEKLENIDKKIDYFKYENIDRYLAYKEKNKTLSMTEVIINVNIGLDNEYYTNTKEAENQNKYYILVNKYNYLTKDYVPKNLENVSLQYARSGMQLVDYVKNAFEKMAKDAKKEGLSLIVTSGYRSYSYQNELYNGYVKLDGQKDADTYSARAGFSEHQTGLAADIYNGKTSYTTFEQTKEFNWMQENAHKYGFILRYPKDKEHITGYKYESWHYRYVGEKIAKYIKENNITYEEYYIKFIENKNIEE